MDPDPTLENLISILESITGVESAAITAQTEFWELAIDSLDHARLIQQCEDSFEIELPQEAHATRTVDALYQLILASYL